MAFRDFFAIGHGYWFQTGLFFLSILIIWELAWKAWGLWKAARANQVGWFVAILIFNTFGILPIIYIYAFKPKDK